MLFSYKDIWDFITPYLYSSKKLPSVKQTDKNAKTYSYPNKELSSYLKKRKIMIFSITDFIFIIRVIIFGRIDSKNRNLINIYL